MSATTTTQSSNENASVAVGSTPATPACGAAWKRCVRWLWSRRWRVGIIGLVAGFALLNAVAFMHARAMTHFVSIFDNLPGPKQFEVFDDAGHESYIARDATRWNQLVSRFLLETEQP